ncbi:ATP-dependent DNA helicase [Mucor ambiguus]|uniref:ATP-dependent DNA helicase n=1 Tax=Mucor ambiguus TaxID=91626 RepID=A0A0C9N221_9FUNG|nr:ATP-dependent DNA helicase [Mucor ambiguus]
MSEPEYQVLEISDTESDFYGTPKMEAFGSDSSVVLDGNNTPEHIDSPGASSQVLDLTAADDYEAVLSISDDEDSTSDKNKQNIAGSSAHNSISLDDDTYAFFVEAGLEDPDELSKFGINIDEINAQKQIAEKLELENKRDHEFALQLQRQWEGESSTSAAAASSSNAPLLFTGTARPDAFFMSQTSLKREVDAIEQESSKKIKLNTNSKDKVPLEIIDDDDDCIDLTNENPIAYRNPYYLVESDDEENVDSDLEDYLSNSIHGYPSRPYFYATSDGAGNSGKRDRSHPLFNIMAGVPRPFADITMPHMQSTTTSAASSVSYSSLMQSHMAAIVAQQNAKKGHAGYPSPTPLAASMYPRPLNAQETERELRELLENIISDEPPPPKDRTGTPDGLSITLLEHQKIGLQWMTKMENSNNRGGILADDMGLGKTIQAMATIVQNPCTDYASVDHGEIQPRGDSHLGQGELKIKATLIVCPVSLMDQWRREIEEKTSPRLKVLVFHGGNRTNDPRQLALYDVIITSYAVTASNYKENSLGPFHKITFHRVILDEAHSIKNKQTAAARSCCLLDANYRWCMTATPIQNKIEELYSLLKFLRIRPFCDWCEFRDTILRPMSTGYHKKAIRVAAVLMKAISLRRSKKALIDGRPILNLPERNIHMTHIDFSPDERVHYDFVNQRAQARFNKYLKQGVVMKKYSSVLVLLLRLRQACLHPHLTLTEGESDPLQGGEGQSEEAQQQAARDMNPEVIQRLLSDSATLSDIECPICMDTAQDAQILKGCGHILCKECLDCYVNTNDGSNKRCPQCRGELNVTRLVGVEAFIKVHAPHLLEALDEKVEEEERAADEEENEALKRVQEYVSSAKIDKMIEILDTTASETGGQDKTIVFSQFTGFLDLIHQPLNDRGYKYLRYDGSMNIKQRADTVGKFFDDPEIKVLLVSTKCGSLGLNLTCANRVILMDVWWNPALENQAIDRVHRIGQSKPVDVHRIFINDTVEDRILTLQEKKQTISDGVLGEGSANNVNRLGVQELLFLFRGGDLPDTEDGPSGSSASALGVASSSRS